MLQEEKLSSIPQRCSLHQKIDMKAVEEARGNERMFKTEIETPMGCATSAAVQQPICNGFSQSGNDWLIGAVLEEEYQQLVLPLRSGNTSLLTD